ncbi:MAG: FAD-binding oxidoreductase [Rhodobacter sp.]|nr:FAD-binding oxidoreductase [Paracoccaceae bacterium]MCC0075017.1 FAD-binding oxidoreductase [Rhodobacter sp.]
MADFLIVGGGIAGLSAGARLATMGRVVVLEGETVLGFHSSGRSAALFEEDYGAPATVACAHASGPELARLGVLSPRGFLLVGQAHERAAFEADAEALKMTVIPPAEARAMVPILHPEKLALAGYTDAAQDIDTDLLMQIYARAIRAAGGEIRTGAPVTAIARGAEGWTVTAGGAEIRGRILVNAAGAWADRLAALAGLPGVGLTPMRRSMAQIPAPEGLDSAGWPMVIGAGETWYMKPQAGKLLVSPADEDPVEPHDAWADDMVLAEGLARFEEMTTMTVTRLETSWAGLRSFAPDRTLVLGPDPRDPGFAWCAGQGGQGFLSAPGSAAVLAEMLGGPASGQPEAVLQALSVARFR